jgi:RAB protein geranylgeranyltransferase component A
MFKTLKQLFATLTAVFTGTEHIANAFVSVTAWAEDEADGFREKAADQRAQARIILQAEFRAANKELGITDDMIKAHRTATGPVPIVADEAATA